MTGQDLRTGLRHLWVNAIGGWCLTPRLLRFFIYRSAGLDVRTANIFPGCRFEGRGGTTIGLGSFVNSECYFDAAAPIRIGRECQIGMQVMITTGTHEVSPDGLVSRTPIAAAVTIGNSCWLGARCLVLPGVTIGDGVLVAAGAVVIEDCAPHGLYAGSPAIRKRDFGC
ncbi:MAG: acyltransferase [Solirubrobacteraceae bacterium]